MGNVFQRHVEHVCIQSPEQSGKRKSLPDTDTEFIHQVVEELIDRIPERSAVTPIASSTSTRSSLSQDCITDLELSRGHQETDTDVTEYESAADTDRSGKLSSSASLLTFSDQLNYDPRDESCSCSFSENDKKLDCVCSLKLSASSVDDDTPSNFALNKESNVLDIDCLDEHDTDKVVSLSSLTIYEAISPLINDPLLSPLTDGSLTSSDVNNFIIVEENSDLPNVDTPDDANTSCSLDIGIEQTNTEDDSSTTQKSKDEVDQHQWNVIHSVEVSDCAPRKEENTDIITKSPEPSIPICDTSTSCSLDIEQLSTKGDNSTLRKSEDNDDQCQWNVIQSNEDSDCVLTKEQNTQIVTKFPEPSIPICDTSPVSILVSSLADSFGDQSTSSCSEVIKASVDLELEKPSQSEVSGYVSENFSIVAAEASKIAEDIHNALVDLECDDTIGKELKMSSLGDVDTDLLDGNNPRSQCEQTLNSLPQNYYLDGGIKETSNNQNSIRVKKAQDDFLENSCKNRKETEESCTELPSKRTADSGACAGENIDGKTKSNHDLQKESMYNKFDDLVDVVSSLRSTSLSSQNEEDSLPVVSSVDDNENSRSSLQIDDSRSTPIRNEALDYIDKLISLSPNQSPRNRPAATMDISNSESQILQKESLIQESPNNSVKSSSAMKWSETSNLDLHKMPERLRQLREVLLQQEAVHKEEIKKYQRKVKSLEDRELQINRKMLEKSQGQQQMSIILEEYEKTISRLVAEKEHERQAYDLEKENLLKEKDAISGHLSNIEIAFSDVHQKYEKSKQVIQGFKNNEEALRATVSDYETALKKQEQKYEILKSHAMGQLESANQELIAMRRTHEAENSKLKAMLKKAEVKIHSLEETLQQKIKENQELVNICDELIGKVGSSE